MPSNLPPWPGILFPPPPPSPPPPPWRPPPPPWSPPTHKSPNHRGAAAVGITFWVLLFFVACRYCRVKGDRQSRANNAATDAAAMPSSEALTLQRPQPAVSDQSRHSEQQQRRAAPAPAPAPEGEPRRRGSPASTLPSFAYNRSVRHNVTSGGGGEEAPPTCSVCLGAFQVGETVRLLPVCLHLYHVECIDPWLDAHSTCPLCRSPTDTTTMDGSLLPTV